MSLSCFVAKSQKKNEGANLHFSCAIERTHELFRNLVPY